ncbi:ficolin-2-like [Drosophila willistoni]|uniref:ficolin-2-like n=1 Tax=Drosophila willistoni TaxID=7260 RepID=UPI001F07127E|nr:ficolin-2-like [Drosophila willistoni]
MSMVHVHGRQHMTGGHPVRSELTEYMKNYIYTARKKLEEYESKLTDSNHSLKRDSLQLNQTAKNLIEFWEKQPKPSCKGLSSGIHTIEIDPISALCEGDLEGGGWIVIHKRFDGNVDFNRTWTEYRNGFGNKKEEFFIGLENLHRITKSQTNELYVQLEMQNGTLQFASYGNFRIGNETAKYKLESLGEFKGTAEDAMKYNLNGSFSTFDQDNDQWRIGNCAQRFGAWWYRHCTLINLNGKYSNREVNDGLSMSWTWISLKSVQMLIRPI